MSNMVYIPSPTGKKFHEARNVETGFVRALMGPIGSGKSVACLMELVMIAISQEPDAKKVRRTRFAIVRNTYRELLDTTVATFFTWIDKESGHWSSLNMSFTFEQQLIDGTKVEAEFLFRALDKPDDVKKLLSLELTAAWLNEARELAKAIVDGATGRVGRYPSKAQGVEATFFGIIMDTNPPDTDHWWYNLLEEDLPNNHKLFKQPSGLAKDAENISNLPRNYYHNIQAGKKEEWIKVYVHGQYGFIADGAPVWSEYNDSLHYTDNDYVPRLDSPIYIGIDFGLTPAALLGQLTTSGGMVLFDELVTFNMGAVNFGKLLKEKLDRKYPGHTFEIYGDPAGDSRVPTDEATPFSVLYNQGILATPTYTNDPIIRREVVADYMSRLDFTGNLAFIITPGAPTFRKACSGGYMYKRMQVAGDERFKEIPNKNKFSHIADAGQYLFLGAVGDSRVVGGFSSKAIDYSQHNIGIV